MKRLPVKLIRRFDVRYRYFVRLNESMRVLDMGCGSGYNGVSLRELYPAIEVHGVDIVPDTSLPGFYSYKVHDLECGVLPYPDNYFDAIVCTHVLEHLHSPLPLGKEIGRIMKPGGTLFVETPNWTTVFVPSFGFHREQHSPFNFYDDASHIKPWSKHGLFDFLVQNCRFRVVKVGTVRNWARVPLDLPIIAVGLMTGKRSYVVSSFWNLFGWCIYGIGVKE